MLPRLTLPPSPAVLAAFALIYAAARESASEETRRVTACAALLILLGCMGLLVHAHEALPELASLAAMCGALAALPYATRKPLRAGLAFGVALGLAFLSATWIAPLSLALAVVVAHFACPEWRLRRSAPFLATAAAAAIAVSATWPLALAVRSPEAFPAGPALWLQPPAGPAENFRPLFPPPGWFARRG